MHYLGLNHSFGIKVNCSLRIPSLKMAAKTYTDLLRHVRIVVFVLFCFFFNHFWEIVLMETINKIETLGIVNWMSILLAITKMEWEFTLGLYLELLGSVLLLFSLEKKSRFFFSIICHKKIIT